MDTRKSGSIILFLTVNLLFFSTAFSKACVVMESPDSYRMMLFQARLGNSSSLQIFNYTPALYASYKPDPDGSDRVRNAKEWQIQTGNDVALEDILSIQYETDPDSLILAHKHNKIKSVFDDNSLITFLSKPSNKALLEYLIFSKQVEKTEIEMLNGFESWDDEGKDASNNLKAKQALFSLAKKYLSSAKGDFLRKRYAFQVCRLAYQLKYYQVAINTYENRFKKFNGNELMNVWSALFYAQSLDATKKGAKANYFYSLVFDNCDSKKLRCHQCFHTDEATFKASLKIAKNAHEKAVMWVIHTINYPGPALNLLQTIAELEPKSEYLHFLIAREINKLEDWICTPDFIQTMPSLSPQWNMNIAKITNQKQDLKYLQDFKSFLLQLRTHARGEMQQFITLSISHLCILADSPKEGLDFLNAMGLTENSSIELQKNLEKAWISAKTTDITSDNFKDQFVIYCRRLLRLAKNDATINKTLYTLLRCVAHEYERHNDFATAGLLYMKSEIFKQSNDQSFETTISKKNSYDKLFYFDTHARVADIDNLIHLIEKKDKSDFEDFICDQPLGTINFYRDLQGTIAFRSDDLKTASRIFKQIPADFWKTNYAYHSYLNEDPFIPKVLSKTRNFHYRFDKNRFIKQLLELQEKAKKKNGNAEACLLLGNAYFNCSYWGNSWMMIRYSWSAAESISNISTTDSLGYTLTNFIYQENNTLLNDNYYNCKTAARYYYQALNDPKATAEQKAYACLMLHECHYLPWFFTNMQLTAPTLKYAQNSYIKELYSTYSTTKVYKDYQCPLLNSFINI